MRVKTHSGYKVIVCFQSAALFQGILINFFLKFLWYNHGAVLGIMWF